MGHMKQTEHFDSFDDLVKALQTTYTLSFKGACKALKSSRRWVQTYIRPHVPFIFLSNGYSGHCNYAILATGGNESVYFNESAFNELIRGAVVSCRKRAKRVRRSYFVGDMIGYCNAMKDYDSRYNKAVEAYNYKAANEVLEEARKLYLDYAKNDYVRKIIEPAIVYTTKRTEAEWVDVPLPDMPIEQWKAVHDIMDYGDVEETIYRRLFAEGYIRVELVLPDKDGVIKDSGKVFYINDPETLEFPNLKADDYSDILDRIDMFTIKQTAWAEYQCMIGNSIT